MNVEIRRRRAGKAVIRGRHRAAALAERLGSGLKESRTALGITQSELSGLTGISQAAISEFERGKAARAPFERWAVLAAALDEQLVVFLERAPGVGRPHDMEHLKRQQLVIETAAPGGWTAMPEEPLDPNSTRSRSIDVLLLRHPGREAVVVEIWNGFTDVGEAMRSLDGKVASLERHLQAGRDVIGKRWRVAGLWVVRGTRRNHVLVGSLGTLFASKFPGSSRGWLAALSDHAVSMPAAHGLLWTNVPGTRLQASRLAIANPRRPDHTPGSGTRCR